jgi:hypothetical protein
MNYTSVKFSEIEDDGTVVEYTIWYNKDMSIYRGVKHVVLYYNDTEKTYIDMYGALENNTAYEKYLLKQIEMEKGTKDKVQLVPVSEFQFWICAKRERLQHSSSTSGCGGCAAATSDPEYDAGDPV